MNSRGIDVDKLSGLSGIDTQQCMAGCLWLMRCDAELLTNQTVQQR